MWRRALIVVFLAFSNPAFAGGYYIDGDELRLVRDVSVNMSDQVQDGCLPNPRALQVEAELILRRSGIGVSEYRPYEATLSIAAFGWEMTYRDGEGTGLCVVYLGIDVSRLALLSAGHLGLVLAYERRQLFAGAGKSEMEAHLLSEVSQIVSDLANEILKARATDSP